MRIVVDTNVMISAVLWLGTPHRIVELAEKKQVVLCMTQPMLDELREVLQRRKFQRYLETRHTSVEEIVSALLPLVELYAPTAVADIALADPDDEIFLGCAISADASFLVSGDDHLLRLKQCGKIKIVTPSDFLREAHLGDDEDETITRKPSAQT